MITILYLLLKQKKKCKKTKLIGIYKNVFFVKTFQTVPSSRFALVFYAANIHANAEVVAVKYAQGSLRRAQRFTLL